MIPARMYHVLNRKPVPKAFWPIHPVFGSFVLALLLASVYAPQTVGLEWLALGKPKFLKMRDKDSQIPGEKTMRLVIWIFLGLDFALACLAMLAMFSHA